MQRENVRRQRGARCARGWAAHVPRTLGGVCSETSGDPRTPCRPSSLDGLPPPGPGGLPWLTGQGISWPGFLPQRQLQGKPHMEVQSPGRKGECWPARTVGEARRARPERPLGPVPPARTSGLPARLVQPLRSGQAPLPRASALLFSGLPTPGKEAHRGLAA